MERNIPHNASETIDFYKRTIYSVLRSKSENRISGLEEVHAAMDSTMHPDARSSSPDYNALIYSILRVPPCMQKVRRLRQAVLLPSSAPGWVRLLPLPWWRN